MVNLDQSTNAQMIEVRIQHTKNRERQLQMLLHSLETDKPHNVKVTIVNDDESCWSGCKKALTCDADYICVLQDDVLVCKDFLPTIEKLVKLVPDKPITLFCQREKANQARDWTRSWLTMKLWFYAQGYIMPKALAKDFLEYAERHTNQRNIDDEKIAIWLWKRDLRVWATMPSLVEHIGWNSTTIRNRDYDSYYKIAQRVAKWFIGYEKSGLDIDWKEGLDCPVQDEDGRWEQLVDNYVE